MVQLQDNAIIFGAYFQTVSRLKQKWTDNDRAFCINLKAKTAQQTMQIALTGKLTN